MSEIKISMKLFGTFRTYGETVELSIRSGSPVAVIKEALASVLGEQARLLIQESVLADEKTILPGSYIFDRDAHLSILPPVCGG